MANTYIQSFGPKAPAIEALALRLLSLFEECPDPDVLDAAIFLASKSYAFRRTQNPTSPADYNRDQPNLG